MRNASVELYRIILILGICLLHASITPGKESAWFANLFYFCVDGFAFISGYYGCRFKVSRVVRLLFLGVICAYMGTCDICDAVRCFSKFWFLYAYLMMMCLAPFADALIEQNGSVILAAPFLALVFCYGYFLTLPLPGVAHLPKTAGVTACSGLTLLGIYICARYCAKFKVEKYVQPRVLTIVFLFCLVLSSLGFNDYNSPIALVLAASSFLLVKQVHFPGFVSKIASFMAPSVFSIYLLQATQIDRMYALVGLCVKDWEINLYVSYCLVALLTFCLCFGYDLLRRLLAFVFNKQISFVCNVLDEVYASLATLRIRDGRIKH